MDQRAVADLQRSGISQRDAEEAGIFYTYDATEIHSSLRKLPALVLPYFTTAGADVSYGAGLPFFRVRYLESPPRAGSFIKLRPIRYAQPESSGTHAYFPRVAGVDWEAIAADVKEPLIITEGEKKSLAATLAGYNTVGLGGVFNWLHGGELLPELQAFKWRTREVYIVFDSDAALNPNIQFAEARLVDDLMRSRGAKVFLTRIPPESDAKVGLDDYLVAHGSQQFEQLLMRTEPLGQVDAAVVALNRHVAWIERDGGVYDVGARHFLKTGDFTRGSKYSADTVRRVITTGKKPGVKEVQTAAVWLTHPLARRYGDLLFRPGEGPLVKAETGAPALNVWNGWDAHPGDVAPFLELTDYLMSRTPAKHRDFALKLLAYKAQHPAEKIPLALVMIGEQGSGKTLWTECVQQAFNPYSVTLPSSALRDVFQGWLERTLLAVINEVEPEDLLQGRDRLKALISDLQRPMNEKFRVARQINSYTSYILTANERAAGSFSHGDRRMVVFGCPSARPDVEFYDRVRDWKNAGGGQHLLHYLLHYDLQGWRPPSAAPMTPEKAMAYQESLTPVQKLADDTLTAQEHTIVLWIDAAVSWANSAVGGSNPSLARYGQEIIDAYNTIQIRPWYTPDEIAMMFPQIASTLYGNKKVQATPSGEISRQLRDSGVPYLECADDPRGFKWRGRVQQFLVVAARDEWAQPITQAEFERYMKDWPRYCDVRVQRLKEAKKVPA